MIFKNSTRLIDLRSFALALGFILLLTGCAASSYTEADKRPIDPLDSQRNAVLQIRPRLVPVTPSPTLVTLPEAGGPQATSPAASPTPIAVEPTATSTQVPATATTPPQVPTVVASAPVQHYAPTRIIIPAINLDAPVIAVGWTVTEQNGEKVSEWNVPAERKVGWLNTSQLVGVPGNTVLVGHQNVDGRVFENLEYLQLGDEIQVQAGNELRRYLIALKTIVPEKDQPLEVRLENARWIGRSDDERLTLITCWPRNDNTHRLIIVALPAT